MSITNIKQLYIKMLSDVQKREESASTIFKTLRETAQEQQVKEILDSAIYLTETATTTLDRCFKLLGEKPVPTDNRLQEVFVEDFKKELEMIQFLPAKTLFVASKASHLMQIRTAELESLIQISDASGHSGISLLLDSVLAQKRVFVDRILTRIAEVLQEQEE
jgi:ferritin-like metal-binding protein YciE